VDTVDGTEALLAAFDGRARTESPSPPAGAWYERDGPLLRVVGEERGFISAPRDTGAGACVRSAAAAPARTRCCRPGRQRTRTCPTAAPGRLWPPRHGPRGACGRPRRLRPRSGRPSAIRAASP